MFEYEKVSYEVENKEDELFYGVMMNHVFMNFSPFEVSNMDFPKKEEMGGVILKFIGGGATYFKVQREMPTDYELDSIVEIYEFLEESCGEYVEVKVICEPHIEIRDIKVPGGESIRTSFVSSRRNNGDEVLDDLIKKLENNEQFTCQDYFFKYIVPFMGRNNDDEFQSKYCKFISLYKKSDFKLPSFYDLIECPVNMNCIF